ncbi:MAG: radical SAM protein [Deltaproteobacteria bacterium]|nr:radical SAM protein [Deltaproteobacteria bacterium]
MKIFLGNAPWRKSGFYGVRAGSRWPHFEQEGECYMPFPFFLAYATALLEREGFEVLLVDGIAADLSDEEFVNRCVDFNPQLILLEVSTPSINQDLAITQKIKNRLNVPVAYAGPHHWMYEPSFLEQHPLVDYVLVGEYEFTLLELVQKLSQGQEPQGLLGIIRRTPQGIEVNPRRPLVEDLDLFPWPARHQLPMMKYNDTPGGIPAPSLQMWASRGCPYHCVFCAWPQIMYGGHKYRVRSPEDVVNEIAWCLQAYDFKSIYFDDDTFNIGKSRILKIAALMKEKGINRPWAIMARADLMDEQTLKELKEAGLVALKYGVESGDQAVLDQSGKGLNLSVVKNVVKITKELGIKLHLTFSFGLPGENADSIKKTIQQALTLDPDSLQFSITTPFPGSAYFEILDQAGALIHKDWEKYDGYNRAVFNSPDCSAKMLEQALHEANKAWKWHILKKRLKIDPISLVRDILSNPIDNFRRFRRWS